MLELSEEQVRNILTGYLSGEITPANDVEAEQVKTFINIIPDMIELVCLLALMDENTSCPFVSMAREIIKSIEGLATND